MSKGEKKMVWNTRPVRLIATGSLLALVLIVAGGAGRGRQVQRDDLGARSYLVPASRIISWDQTIGMLDTVTGAVYKLEGSLDNPGARLSWKLRVPPVTGETSGLLEIQRATFNRPDATFLVDIVTGRTWILRRRASSNGSWDPVTIAP
jgi:hypothetical protein